MKKMLSSCIATLLLVGMLAGCAPKVENPGTVSKNESKDSTESSAATGASGMSVPGEFPIVTEKQTFKVMVPQVSYLVDLSTNDFYKWYEEKTNVKIEFDLVAETALKEKVSLTLASNKLPDAFLYCGVSTADLIKYGEQGLFIPINDMIESQSTYMKEAFDKNELLPEAITAPDGNIYGIPEINECYHCFYSGKAWINNEWLKNVNMEYPKTTEEFYNVLKAFKEKDANGNGDPNDEIPMMGSDKGWNNRPYDFLLNSFVYNDYGPRIALNDGKIGFVANTPEFKDGLTYIRKLISEGLLDPVSLTQTGEQFAIIGGDPENITVGSLTSATWWSGLGSDDTDPLKRSRQYIGLSPLEGPKGVKNVLTQKGGINATHFIITNTCENPEVLFRWAEGQYAEDVLYRANLGEEGVHWKKPAEGIKGINGKPALYEVLVSTTGTDPYNFSIPNLGIGNRSIDFRAGQAVMNEEEAKWGAEARLEAETKEHFEAFASEQQVPSILLTADEAAERARLEVPITDYVLENIVAFLSGSKDIEKDWDSYVKEFDALELTKYLEALQIGYDRQYK